MSSENENYRQENSAWKSKSKPSICFLLTQFISVAQLEQIFLSEIFVTWLRDAN